MKRERNKLMIGRWTITADRFPWQLKTQSATLDFDAKKKVGDRWGWGTAGGMGRFGGGWDWKLGVMLGGSSVIFDLLFGSIRVHRSCEAHQSVRRNMIVTRLVTLGPLAVAVASALYLIL